MERQIERGCGLDVHRDTVAACVRVLGARGGRERHVRTFGTTAADLLRLHDRLGAHGVTHVAMESTGVYWKPVFYVLEDAFTCLLVNAAHIEQVPGRRRTSWIASGSRNCWSTGAAGQLGAQVEIRELRDLTRHRKVLIQERQRAANRLHKLLQDAGIKLASVATDILGVSGRAMLEALVQGTTDAAVLADWRGASCAKSWRTCDRSGRAVRAHHAFLIGQLLATWTIWMRLSPREWGGRDAPGPFRSPREEAGQDTRDSAAEGGGDSGGDRRGHDSLSE